jgi:hypothetical protein
MIKARLIFELRSKVCLGKPDVECTLQSCGPQPCQAEHFSSAQFYLLYPSNLEDHVILSMDGDSSILWLLQ